MQGGIQLTNYQQYSSHFNDVSLKIVNAPIKQRNYTNIQCVFVFFIMVGLFLGMGCYQISQWNSVKDEVSLRDDSQLSGNYGYIIGGVAISIGLSCLYVFLLKTYTELMVYAMIIASLSVIGLFAIVGIASGNFALFVMMLLFLLIYGIILCCYRKQIKIGIVLVKIATKFLGQKMIIFLIPVCKFVLTFIFGFFLIIATNATISVIDYKNTYQLNADIERATLGIFTFCSLMFTFIFYYMMTFVISLVCSDWYYGKNQITILRSYQIMIRQFGSLVFAALVLAIVTIIRMIVQSKRGRSKNIAIEICLCIVACFLKAIEDLLKVLNHYTIILIALTGQDYIEGAKSTIGLVWQQLPLLYVTNLICNLLIFCGLIISILTPSFLIYLIMDINHKEALEIFQCISIVILSSLLISTIVLEIIVESTSCVFIYYVMDKNFCNRGLIEAKRMSEDIHYSIQNSSIITEGKDNENYQRVNQ